MIVFRCAGNASLLLTQVPYLFSIPYMHTPLEILIFLSKVASILQIR